MRYTYTYYGHGNRIDITTRFEEVESYFKNAWGDIPWSVGTCVEVWDSAQAFVTTTLHNQDGLEMWRENLERATAWKSKAWNPLEDNEGFDTATVDATKTLNEKELEKEMVRKVNALTLGQLSGKKKDAINPSHYKDYIDDMQWLDAMSKIPTLRKPERFKAALELQIRKYLDRNGSKDATIQELKKARFYLQYLISYIENDEKPIFAADVHKLLKN